MTDDSEGKEREHAEPPTDAERLGVLARLIQGRIHALSSLRSSRQLTAAEARELRVLEWLRDDWLLETRH